MKPQFQFPFNHFDNIACRLSCELALIRCNHLEQVKRYRTRTKANKQLINKQLIEAYAHFENLDDLLRQTKM